MNENDFLGDPALPHSPVPSLPSLTNSGESFLRKRIMEGSTTRSLRERKGTGAPLTELNFILPNLHSDVRRYLIITSHCVEANNDNKQD